MDTKTISSHLPSQYGSSGSPTSLTSMMAERTRAAAVNTEKSMDINLVTKEGDKVTISLDAKMAALTGSYENFTMDESGYASQKTDLTYSQFQRDLTFTVEGDLSEDERKDIRQLMKTLDKMIDHYVNGQMKPVMAGARKIEGLDSLAELDATVSYQREVLLAEQTNVTVVTSEAASEEPASASDAEAAQTMFAQLADGADAVGDVIAEKLKSNQARLDKMMAYFDKVMDRYRQQVGDQNELGAGMLDRIADRVNDMLTQNSQNVAGVE